MSRGTKSNSSARTAKYWKTSEVRDAIYQSMLAEGWDPDDIRLCVSEERKNNGKIEPYIIDIKAVDRDITPPYARSVGRARLILIVDLKGSDYETIADRLVRTEEELVHARHTTCTDDNVPRTTIEMRAYYLNSSVADFMAAMKGYKPHRDLSIKLNPTDGKPRWIKE